MNKVHILAIDSEKRSLQTCATAPRLAAPYSETMS